MRRNKTIVFVLAVFALSFSILSSVEAQPKNRISVSGIPDTEYTVYFYKGYGPSEMAVVFDIPDDGYRVFMYHTMFARRKTGRPDDYLGYFQRRIRGFRTAYEILDQDGRVRGYMMTSRFLGYQLLSFGDSTGIRIRDYFGGRR